MAAGFARCYVYVDGAWVRKTLHDAGQAEFFDPTKPAQFVRNAKRLAGMDFAAVRIFYYDAVDDSAPQEEQLKLKTYLERVRVLPDTHVVTGFVRPGKRRREQKGVDVQLAVDALEAARSSGVDAIALVAGDADFVPLIEAVRHAGPHVLLLTFREHVSKELVAVSDRCVYFPEPPTDWELRPST